MARKKANGKAKGGVRDTGCDANLEQDSGDAPIRAEETSRFTSPVHVRFTHYRKRLADLDNLSTKAVLDAVVRANLLADDSAQQVAEITHRQIKSDIERTVVEIIEV